MTSAVGTRDLVAAYEDLRLRFMRSWSTGGSAGGLAVLQRHGMACWMEVCARPRPAAACRGDHAVDPDLRRTAPAIGFQAEVVQVLASMALSIEWEVTV